MVESFAARLTANEEVPLTLHGSLMAYPRHNVTIALEIASLCMALLCGCVLGWAMFGPDRNYLVLTIAGTLFTAFLLSPSL